MVSFHWRLFSNDLCQFLSDIKVFNVEIKGYKKTLGISPKALLKISTLNFIKFESSEKIELPNAYINEARKLAVTTIFNGEIITYGTLDKHFPVIFNVDYQSYGRFRHFPENERFLDYVINEMKKK